MWSRSLRRDRKVSISSSHDLIFHLCLQCSSKSWLMPRLMRNRHHSASVADAARSPLRSATASATSLAGSRRSGTLTMTSCLRSAAQTTRFTSCFCVSLPSCYCAFASMMRSLWCLSTQLVIPWKVTITSTSKASLQWALQPS